MDVPFLGVFAKSLALALEESDEKLEQNARESKSTRNENFEPAPVAPFVQAAAPLAAAAPLQAAVLPASAFVPQMILPADMRQVYFNHFFNNPYFAFPQQPFMYRLY